MIVSKMSGGLGNQMFQYAAGLCLAQGLKTDFFYDDSEYEYYGVHEFSLLQLNVTAKNKNPFYFSKKNKLFRLLNRILPLKYKLTSHQEKSFSFDPDFFKLTGNLYLQGYWQSEKYFMPIRDLLLKEFSLKKPLSNYSQDILNKIKSCPQTASLHIRRGDYVTNPDANKVHGTTALEYYENAVQMLSQKVGNLHLFIFSDDPEWCKQNLKVNYECVYIDGNSDRNYEDLFLMSQCRHNIIANSTFSWWGAWLNLNADKQVYVPKKWFKHSQHDESDLIPTSWVRI